MKKWHLLAFILLVTFLVFSPVLKSDFVNWDDDVNVTINPNVKKLNTGSIIDMFTHTVVGGYTPLTTLSFAVENHFFGMKPGVFHFNNLLLHLLCTMLVFVLMRKLETNLFVSFVVTFLFGIHPMRVESVAWITERKDVLYSFFYLLSLISYITFYKSKRLIFYFLALLAFIFALLSKIQAVSLPLILLLIDYFFEKKFQFKHVLDKIPFFILSLVTGLTGIYFLGHEGTLETSTVLPFIQRIFIGTYSFCVYLIKSVLPYQLSAIYPNPVKLSLLYYASALLVILLALLIYKSGKYRKVLIFGSLFFLFNVMFMLQIVGAGQAFIADRFTYIAYIGLFFLIAWALNFLFISKWKTYVIFLGVIYLAVLATATWNRTQVWKNTETLFSDVIRKYPKFAIAFNNLGLYYREQNQYEKAMAAYGKSIEINPEGYLSYSNRGETYFDRGEIDKALEDMNMAIKLKPDYSKAWSNRGAVFGSKKEFALALKDLDKAIALDAKNLKAYTNRSLVYYSLGNFEKASQDVTSYLQIKRDDADILNLRGLCFSRLNKNQEALADFNKSIQLNPKAGAFFQNRSSLLYKMGDTKGALIDILKAQELGVQVNPGYLQMLKTK
ncbi:MAG: tetratricopeptide repeat protein [Porphyromonadaceae bacterium]|nr:MAG: tetratricopeptide repeat protein [Porphyromonadaceae bacterium]